MLAAADSYSYLHLLLVAGIIIFAVGVRFVVRDAGASLSTPARLTLCGGVALYLAGHFAFRMRIAREAGAQKLLVAGLALVLVPVGASFPAWLETGVLAALLVAMCAAETVAP